MSNFIPDQPKESVDVPFFEDVTSAEGWQGQTTTKTINALKSEITISISRMGGVITAFRQGKFLVNQKERNGYQILYNLETSSGGLYPCRLDIAALPVRGMPSSSFEKRTEKSMRMALYMAKISLDGLWFLQQLSPGYAPLMPFLLNDGGKTITQLWSESPVMSNLLPSGDFIEGDVKEIK